MRLKRWAMTFMDNWAAMETFWTMRSMCERLKTAPFGSARMYHWQDGKWVKFEDWSAITAAMR